MIHFGRKVDIGGRKIPYSKVSIVIDSIVDNIILSGFETPEELCSKIISNTGFNFDFEVKVINKIMDIYTNNMRLEMSKLAIQQSSISVVGDLSEKCIIIMHAYNEIIGKLCNNNNDDEEDEFDDYVNLITNEQD